MDTISRSAASIYRNCIARPRCLLEADQLWVMAGRMPGSRASVFGEAEDFQAALSAEGVAGMLLTVRGPFRARLTQVELEHIRLLAVEEVQSRVAFVVVPRGIVSVLFPIDRGPSPIWGGIEIRTGEIVSFGPGQRLHTLTLGPCHWGAVQVPAQQLADYGRAVLGSRLKVPPAARWRPSRAARREMRNLHRAAIRLAEARSGALTDLMGAHGLEQQLLDSLIECLSEGSEEDSATGHRHRDILARFEDLLATKPVRPIAEICAALDVSERLLRDCCQRHLGMGPRRYRQLCAMQQVYRVLRSGTPDAASVAHVARQHGFRDLGRLAATYRALYGELPSATLRRGLGRELTMLSSRQRQSSRV
jgi:AraC-like DNA-binding protein